MHKNYGLSKLHEMSLKLFEAKGRPRLPSSSLISQNDASLLLINSGVAPMKSWFTGEQEPPRHRVTTCQECVRTDDIGNIGRAARHGTHLGMLDGFSFDDYSKRDVIYWAQESLTSPEWMGLKADRSYPSVFAGNETTPADDGASRIWNEEVGTPVERVFKFDREDSFWEHDSDPCGPCSEVYYDRDPEWDYDEPSCTVSCDYDRYIEVWNIIFPQLDNDGEGHYVELKQKNIGTDTGLGRLACVCQNMVSLFDMGIAMDIANKVPEITHAYCGETAVKDVSLRVTTDHVRSSAFMICDGVLPSNEGRGYVLRRLLCRVTRHGKLLDVNEPFLYEVRDTTIHEDGGHCPELRERWDYITKVIRIEKEDFARTIDSGLKIFGNMLAGYKARGENTFFGVDTSKLYDTYGFPADLALEMVEEQDIKLDKAEFHNRMDEQRQCARKAWEALGDLSQADVKFSKDVPETQFVDYGHTVIDGTEVVALVVENEQTEELMPGVEVVVVLDKIPPYTEMDGQVANHGVISTDGVIFQITDMRGNKGGKYMHTDKLTQGVLKVGGTVFTFIDVKRYKVVMRVHPATHLLDVVLRKVLGDYVRQASSLVEPDKLYLDFTYFAALTVEELSQTSTLVNEMVLKGCEVNTEVFPIGEAKQRGVIALFSEKYGDTVQAADMDQGFSAELCGGIHLDNIARVGVFHIDSEFSATSGARRIEATTDLKPLEATNRAQSLLLKTAAILRVKPAELCEKTEWNMAELRETRHIVKKFQARGAAGETERFLMGDHDLGEPKVFITTLPSADATKPRQMGGILRDKQPNVVAVLSAVNDGKIALLAVCGKGAVPRGVKVGDITKNVTAICGGRGDGKPGSAMDRGNDLLKLDGALAKVDNLAAEKLGL